MEFFKMQKCINLGNKKDSLLALHTIASKRINIEVKIINTHITEINKILGRKVFKRDALYINSESLWEIMQPVGGKGRHHYHGLSPENVFETLATIRFSKNVTVSYDDRYLILTLATIFDEINIAVVVTPKGYSMDSKIKNINRIITIYPYGKK